MATNRSIIWLQVLMTVISLCAIGLSSYVGLRLEPVIQRVEMLDSSFESHILQTTPLIERFIITETRQDELVRNQEKIYEELRMVNSELKLLRQDIKNR